MKRFQSDFGVIHEAKAEDVYPTIEPGSVTLVHSDGPYGLSKADWDRMKVADLSGFYESHIEAWGHLCAPSASLYHWGTAEGWAMVHPVYLRHGWTFRALVMWDKGIGFLAGKCDVEGCRTWPDVTEMCGFYQREGLTPLGCPAQYVAYAAGASEGNQLRAWLNAERERAGLSLVELKRRMTEAGGAGEMIVRHSFYESQWLMPTWDQWRLLHQVWNTSPRGPYLQRDCSSLYDGEALRAEYEALRAEYEALRAPFTLPPGVTNVWSHPLVGGAERFKGEGGALHPCQKPEKLIERIIRASSRPGELILEPFGGVCPVARVCERIARFQPAEARRYVCVELNQDGPDYIGAVVDKLRRDSRQVTMFEPGAKQAEQKALFNRVEGK